MGFKYINERMFVLLGWKHSTIFCATSVQEEVLRQIYPLNCALQMDGTVILLILLGYLIQRGKKPLYVKTCDVFHILLF